MRNSAALRCPTAVCSQLRPSPERQQEGASLEPLPTAPTSCTAHCELCSGAVAHRFCASGKCLAERWSHDVGQGRAQPSLRAFLPPPRFSTGKLSHRCARSVLHHAELQVMLLGVGQPRGAPHGSTVPAVSLCALHVLLSLSGHAQPVVNSTRGALYPGFGDTPRDPRVGGVPGIVSPTLNQSLWGSGPAPPRAQHRLPAPLLAHCSLFFTSVAT